MAYVFKVFLFYERFVARELGLESLAGHFQERTEGKSIPGRCN